jgi:hypothetical protein
MTFDERGNLVESMELNIETFREIFVDKWQDKTSTRRAIFQDFEAYISDFKNLITPNFVMWVDGSFVTAKNDNPNDIDFVSFIDYTVYEARQALIDSRFNKYGSKNHYGILLDAYICTIYPAKHEKGFHSKSDEMEWFHQFSHTKPDKKGKKYAKSFVKIKFTEND